MRRGATVAALLVLMVGGCSSRSASVVTSQSIVEITPGMNLVGDGGFEQSGLGPWRVSAPRDARIRTVDASGSRVLSIQSPSGAAPRAVILEQLTDVVPVGALGTYVLRARLRTFHYRGSIRTEARLNYAGGGYAFFEGHESDSTGRQLPSANGTSAGWLAVSVVAPAQRPVASVDVFVVEARPTGGSGTIWVSDVSLRHTR